MEDGCPFMKKANNCLHHPCSYVRIYSRILYDKELRSCTRIQNMCCLKMSYHDRHDDPLNAETSVQT